MSQQQPDQSLLQNNLQQFLMSKINEMQHFYSQLQPDPIPQQQQQQFNQYQFINSIPNQQFNQYPQTQMNNQYQQQNQNKYTIEQRAQQQQQKIMETIANQYKGNLMQSNIYNMNQSQQQNNSQYSQQFPQMMLPQQNINIPFNQPFNYQNMQQPVLSKMGDILPYQVNQNNIMPNVQLNKTDITIQTPIQNTGFYQNYMANQHESNQIPNQVNSPKSKSQTNSYNNNNNQNLDQIYQKAVDIFEYDNSQHESTFNQVNNKRVEDQESNPYQSRRVYDDDRPIKPMDNQIQEIYKDEPETQIKKKGNNKKEKPKETQKISQTVEIKPAIVYRDDFDDIPIKGAKNFEDLLEEQLQNQHQQPPQLKQNKKNNNRLQSTTKQNEVQYEKENQESKSENEFAKSESQQEEDKPKKQFLKRGQRQTQVNHEKRANKLRQDILEMNNLTNEINDFKPKKIEEEKEKRNQSPVIKSKFTEKLQDKDMTPTSTKKTFLQRGKGKLAASTTQNEKEKAFMNSSQNINDNISDHEAKSPNYSRKKKESESENNQVSKNDSNRIQELQNELANYKKIEADMKKEKQKYAEMIKQVEKMARDQQKEFEQEKQLFEEWKEQRLKKEKGNPQLSKKEKEELNRLRVENQKLTAEINDLEKKYKTDVEKLKKELLSKTSSSQIISNSSLINEKKQQQSQQQQHQIQHQQVKDVKGKKSQNLVQKEKNQSIQHNVDFFKEMKYELSNIENMQRVSIKEFGISIDPLQFQYQNNQFYVAYTKEKPQKSISSNSTPDGKIQKLYPDGKKEVLFPNGVKRESYPNSYVIVHFANQDIKQTLPNGVVVYYFAEADTTQTTIAEGPNIYLFANKQIEIHNQDGSKEIKFADGTEKYIHDGGEEETIFQDGTIQRVDVDKVKYIEYPDGKVDIIYPDGKKIEQETD